MKLFERIEKIAIHFEGSRAGLAKRLASLEEKTPRAIEGYFNEGREDNFWPLLPKILTMYPEIHDTWLYLGRGPALKSENVAPQFSVTNAAGKYPGDLLGAALGKMPPEQAAEELGWSVNALLRLLESREIPTFAQLEQLYVVFDIDPAYFFHGDGRRMHRPKDALLQVYYALGKRHTEPDVFELVELFEISEEKADAFLKEWKTARKEKRNLELPKSWLETLEERYRFNAGWLAYGVPPVIQHLEKAAQRKQQPSSEGGAAQTLPTPHVDVNLLQKAIELIENYLQSNKRIMSPTIKAKTFAQCYEKLFEEGEDSKSVQRMKLIIDALVTAPS